MSLNTENENPAYLCGRLFAVLEKLQLDAAEDKLNRTIKDAYFASACSTPAIAFSKLMRLAQYHIPKASHGSDWSYLMGEITSKLDGEFPSILTLQEQGAFILGYYHQFWVRKEKTEEAETNKENKKELS